MPNYVFIYLYIYTHANERPDHCMQKQLGQPVSKQQTEAKSCLIQIAVPGKSEESARVPTTQGVNRVIEDRQKDVNEKQWGKMRTDRGNAEGA